MAKKEGEGLTEGEKELARAITKEQEEARFAHLGVTPPKGKQRLEQIKNTVSEPETTLSKTGVKTAVKETVAIIIQGKKAGYNYKVLTDNQGGVRYYPDIEITKVKDKAKKTALLEAMCEAAILNNPPPAKIQVNPGEGSEELQRALAAAQEKIKQRNENRSAEVSAPLAVPVMAAVVATPTPNFKPPTPVPSPALDLTPEEIERQARIVQLTGELDKVKSDIDRVKGYREDNTPSMLATRGATLESVNAGKSRDYDLESSVHGLIRAQESIQSNIDILKDRSISLQDLASKMERDNQVQELNTEKFNLETQMRGIGRQIEKASPEDLGPNYRRADMGIGPSAKELANQEEVNRLTGVLREAETRHNTITRTISELQNTPLRKSPEPVASPMPATAAPPATISPTATMRPRSNALAPAPRPEPRKSLAPVGNPKDPMTMGEPDIQQVVFHSSPRPMLAAYTAHQEADSPLKDKVPLHSFKPIISEDEERRAHISRSPGHP